MSVRMGRGEVVIWPPQGATRNWLARGVRETGHSEDRMQSVTMSAACHWPIRPLPILAMARFAPLAVAALLNVVGACSALAQDPFEIQVYEYETVPRGRWNLETHLNYVARGVREYEGPVAPTQGQTHLTFELTRGISRYFELAGYLVTARRQGRPGELAGWRVRPRFRLPEDWLPVKFSLSTEVGFPKRDFEDNSITLELRPILERNFGSGQVDLNPVLGRSLRGPGAADGWDFEPG